MSGPTTPLEDADKLILPLAVRTTPQVCIFRPHLFGEGFRDDNPMNWSTLDVAGSVAGDGADLYGNYVKAGRDTRTYATLRFRTGIFAVVSGKRIIEEQLEEANIQVSRCGQVDTAGGPGFYSATGGRLAFTATNSGAELDLSGDAEVIFARTQTVADLAILGGAAFVGWDYTSGSTSLTITDTLAFIAETGKIGKIAQFRSGRNGATDPNVAGSVTLASGLAVTVDSTGLVAGTYDLIVANSITNNGAILPSGVSIVGGSTLRLTVV